jgi:hypothetical protein
MDHYDRMDRLFDHVDILQVQNGGSNHCGNRAGSDFVLWAFLEFLLHRIYDIQVLYTCEGVPDEYEVLHNHSGREKPNAGMAGRYHPNPGVQGITA